MSLRSPVEIVVTTYEVDPQGTLDPTISHTGHGKTLSEAFEKLKSHLITDDFFSGSFAGGIPWKGTFLRLSNEGKILGAYPYTNDEYAKVALMQLTQEAARVNSKKEELGRFKQLEILTRAEGPISQLDLNAMHYGGATLPPKPAYQTGFNQFVGSIKSGLSSLGTAINPL